MYEDPPVRLRNVRAQQLDHSGSMFQETRLGLDLSPLPAVERGHRKSPRNVLRGIHDEELHPILARLQVVPVGVHDQQSAAGQLHGPDRDQQWEVGSRILRRESPRLLTVRVKFDQAEAAAA